MAWWKKEDFMPFYTFGLIVAVIVFVWNAVITGHTMEASFLSVFGFLWVWYWISTVVTVLFVAFIVTVGIRWMTLALRALVSNLGSSLGLLAGGVASFIVIMRIMFSRMLLLGGTYLLMTSGTKEMVFSQFDTSKLILGTLLLVIGLVVSRKSKLSFSNK